MDSRKNMDSAGVILALISSLAISLSLIAVLAARMLGRRSQPRQPRGAEGGERGHLGVEHVQAARRERLLQVVQQCARHARQPLESAAVL